MSDLKGETLSDNRQHDPEEPDATVIDPVCGMHIDPATPHRYDLNDTTYHFCSARCREKFAADPDLLVR